MKMFGAVRRSRRVALVATGIAALCLLGGIYGCEDSQPASCLVGPEGAFQFTFTLAQSVEEIMGVTERTVTLTSRDLLSLEITRYVLQAGGTTYWLDLEDLGYALPLTVGQSYAMRVERVQDEFFNGYALHFYQGEDLAVMIESDWSDGQVNPDFNYVYREGYGTLGLDVRFGEAGCEARQRDSQVYRELTTWAVTFSRDGQNRTLFHKQQAALGPYTVRVVKAQRESFNSGYETEIGPQFSWILMPSEAFGGGN